MKNSNKNKKIILLTLISAGVILAVLASSTSFLNRFFINNNVVNHVHVDIIKSKKLIDTVEETRVLNWIKNNSTKNPIAVYQGPINGIYEVYSNEGVFYISGDLRYIFNGDIYDNMEKRNLTDVSNKILRMEMSISNAYNGKEDASNLDPSPKKPTESINNQVLINDKSHFQSQDDLEKKALSNLVKSQDSSTPNTNSLLEYRAKIEDKIRTRLQKYKQPSSIAANTQPAGIKEQTADKSKINLSQMQVGTAFVQYKGTTIQKIGFDKAGNKLGDEEAQAQVKKMYQDIAGKGDKWSIVYPAIGKEKIGVVVFSDPTCGYCRRLHQSIPELNKAGVSIHYLMYPRALGLGENDLRASSVLRTMENIWCSASPADSMNDAYKGRSLMPGDCSILEEQGRANFPAREHFFLGSLFSIEGTPMSFTSDGRVFEGFGGTRDYLNEIGL